MALLYRRAHAGRIVEVRSAGRTRRLYVDGVLHTQYSPVRPLSGSIWDHLALGGLFAPPAAIDRVLMLGLGGGAVVHLLERYVRPTEIVAVEIDPLHIRLARRYFGAARPNVTIVEGDARDFVRQYDGPPFDLVIDDLFFGHGEARRAVPFDEAWTEALLRLSKKPGWVVVNFSGRQELLRAPLWRMRKYARRFPSVFQFQDPTLENATAVFCGKRTTTPDFWRRVESEAPLARADAKKLMRFELRRLR